MGSSIVYSSMGFKLVLTVSILLLFFGNCRCEENGVNGTKFVRELIPLEAPQNVTLMYFDDRDAVLNWNPVSLKSVRGTFRGYILRIWNNHQSQVYAIPAETTKTAVQFFPYSKNFVTVSVRNDKYLGPRSEAVSFDAPQTGLPFLFEDNQLGTQSALLRWSRPSNPNGILLGYNLYCGEAGDFGVNQKTTVKEFIVGPDNTQAKITGLKLGQKYQIDVAAVNCAGEGERNTLFVEVEPHQSYPPTMSSFKYVINYNQTDKDEFIRSECLKPRYSLAKIALDHQDDHLYVLGKNSTRTKKPLTSCLVKTLIKWIPDIDHNPGEYFYVKYRLKGAVDWMETLPEQSEDYLIMNDFNACKSYEIILVAVDGDFRTESEIDETPAVRFMDVI